TRHGRYRSSPPVASRPGPTSWPHSKLARPFARPTLDSSTGARQWPSWSPTKSSPSSTSAASLPSRTSAHPPDATAPTGTSGTRSGFASNVSDKPASGELSALRDGENCQAGQDPDEHAQLQRPVLEQHHF